MYLEGLACIWRVELVSFRRYGAGVLIQGIRFDGPARYVVVCNNMAQQGLRVLSSVAAA